MVYQTFESSVVDVPIPCLFPVVHTEPPPGAPGASAARRPWPAQPRRARSTTHGLRPGQPAERFRVNRLVIKNLIACQEQVTYIRHSCTHTRPHSGSSGVYCCCKHGCQQRGKANHETRDTTNTHLRSGCTLDL